MRNVAIFFCAFILGLVIQATVFHTMFPASIAPDFLLILVFSLALNDRSALGAVGAFFLGLGGDFASARFVGPTAAGMVVAYCVIVACANHVYAERGPAVVIITFLASLVKSAVYALMLAVYTSVDVLTQHVLLLVFGEALVTALLAPLVLKLFHTGKGHGGVINQVQISEAYRRG